MENIFCTILSILKYRDFVLTELTARVLHVYGRILLKKMTVVGGFDLIPVERSLRSVARIKPIFTLSEFGFEFILINI